MNSDYRLGIDVGGTFTDLLLIDDASGASYSAKVPSTPDDPARGVLDGVARICSTAGIEPQAIGQVMHGTTVATNTVLEGKGARVGLVTTRGYRQILQIARSYVPGGLGAWVVYRKSPPMAPLELTVEADERIGARGEVVRALDEDALRATLRTFAGGRIEALTVSLINAFANDVHERRIRDLAELELPGVPVSLSSEVIPEMQEYERTVTTVANSYVRPRVERYIGNLEREFAVQLGNAGLDILRSDGGLASAAQAARYPVKLLMSGPAGGVAGAIWVGRRAGYENLLTLDMGGTSTDVALVENGQARLRRETTVGDVTVRASSIDIRTVGAGGGSIAHVPALTRALRVGPQSAGADPGPAAYARGGTAATVTDANVVLGYLPGSARLGGDMAIDAARARAAVAAVAGELGLDTEQAAAGIYDIVNENMFGALRLVSVEQGYDPRDFALVAFGGAGPLHANALGRLMGSWPVVIPPGPGVLCAYGDATTRLREEASRTFVRRFTEVEPAVVAAELRELGASAAATLAAAGVAPADQAVSFEADLRYHGQGLQLTVEVSPEELAAGFEPIGARFDALHEQMFTFALSAAKEFVNLRAVVLGPARHVSTPELPAATAATLPAALLGQQPVYVDHGWHDAPIYDRAKLARDARLYGPAIVTEMDSTTLILPGHEGRVDAHGNLLINPVAGERP
ncbi:MAG: hydantoinase/oxoprolinase family protein [Gammaproteobacteria bacterium]